MLSFAKVKYIHKMLIIWGQGMENIDMEILDIFDIDLDTLIPLDIDLTTLDDIIVIS